MRITVGILSVLFGMIENEKADWYTFQIGGGTLYSMYITFLKKERKRCKQLLAKLPLLQERVAG